MKTLVELKEMLRRIDHKGYPAYKDLTGSYEFEGYRLNIDHVQGDPFASPSKVSIDVKGALAAFPVSCYDKKHKRIALQDHLLRQFSRQIEAFAFQANGSGKSGLMSVSRCGQEVLERSACQIEEKSGDIRIRMEIGFPANGRTINARELEKILFDFLPVCVKKSLYFRALDEKKVQQVIQLSEDQQYIREQLASLKLAAFVANGAVLPRESGVSERPMRGAVPFKSPKSLEVTLNLPYAGNVTGMGIGQGITLIVGGGYHGKSTLLKALEAGVYNHIAGDGREYVITDASAMKIRAEDGRSIRDVDVSMFINDLPNGKDTKRFSTEDASGSTSQAANVIEAMEAGTRLLLIDEDTSATNFMIRDELMQRVVHRDAEPITPFIDRVEELYKNYEISTILVAGSSGSYFHKADCILQMDRYVPKDITEFAREEAENFPIPTEPAPESKKPSFQRGICKKSRKDNHFRGSSSYGKADAGTRRGRAGADRGQEKKRVKIKVMGRDGFSVNHENVDLRYVEQIADAEQMAALAYLLNYAQTNFADGTITVAQAADRLEEILQKQGFMGICSGSYLPANLAMPRRQEIFACLNRYRG